MAGFADHVARRWREPDAGIWEIRGDAQHHVHSKLMAWLALDRALRIADTHRVISSSTRSLATASRDAIAEEVRARGFNETRGATRARYGSDDLDAAAPRPAAARHRAARLAPRARHDRRDRAETSTPAVHSSTAIRPAATGFPVPKAPSCRARSGSCRHSPRPGAIAEATERFAALVQLATPLGLYAEEMDPISGEHLGNFPQALTHAALVQAALALRDAAQ